MDHDNKNIIFAFEVFAVNKNKEDFAETLDLIRQVLCVRSPQHPSSSEDSGDIRRSPQSSAQRDFGNSDPNDEEEETI